MAGLCKHGWVTPSPETIRLLDPIYPPIWPIFSTRLDRNTGIMVYQLAHYQRCLYGFLFPFNLLMF
jgi:hypothetical protein